MFEKAQRLETLLFCETVNSQNSASAEPPNSAEAEATTTSADKELPGVESAAAQDSAMVTNSGLVVATETENKPEVPNNEDTKNDQPVDFVPAVASTSTEPVQTSTSEPAPLLQRFPTNITKLALANQESIKLTATLSTNQRLTLQIPHVPWR